MKDYFIELLEKIKDKKYEITWENISTSNQKQNSILLKYNLAEAVDYIYRNYDLFELNWVGKKHKGFIQFISSNHLEGEHEELIEIMRTCYNVQEDCLEIREDIKHWYPLFKFPNGDCFCLDVRTGKVVFYEHEVYDSGINLHGLTIALSINDLFDKWSKCMFVDIYDWYEGTNVEGIDVNMNIYKDLL